MNFTRLTVVALFWFLWATTCIGEMVIRPHGKVGVISTNGNVQLDIFYVASSPTWKYFGQYWVVNPYKRQALATPFSNNIVDLGERLCCFSFSSADTMWIYLGVTNVTN